MIYTHLKSITTQSFGHFLRMFLALLMAVTSNAPLLPIHVFYTKIGKGGFFSHKVVSLCHPLICTLHICFVVGRELQVMCMCLQMQKHVILLSLQGSTTWLMLASLYMMNF
jgi:hypothetical protein